MKYLIALAFAFPAFAQTYEENARAYENAVRMQETVNKVAEHNIRFMRVLRYYESKLGGLGGLRCSHDYSSKSGATTTQQWCHQNQCVDVDYVTPFNPFFVHDAILGAVNGWNRHSNPAEASERKKEIRSCRATSGEGYTCELNYGWASCYHPDGKKISLTAPAERSTARERSTDTYESTYSAPYRRRYFRTPRDRILRRWSYR